MKYQILDADVNIRKGKTPAIVEYTEPGTKQHVSNKIGQYEAGTLNVEVLSTFTDQKGDLWGRVSEPDGAGSANWFCIRNVNRLFAKPMENAAGQKVRLYIDDILVYQKD